MSQKEQQKLKPFQTFDNEGYGTLKVTGSLWISRHHWQKKNGMIFSNDSLVSQLPETVCKTQIFPNKMQNSHLLGTSFVLSTTEQ